jgi:ArsR family transcriptional regulator
MFLVDDSTIFQISQLIKIPMAPPIPDEFLDLMAEKFRMLADPTRLAILRSLMAGERSVSQVVEETGRGQANVSKHLKMLAGSGLVARRKEGLQVFYRVADPLVERLCKLACETIAAEARQGVERGRKLLKGWKG